MFYFVPSCSRDGERCQQSREHVYRATPEDDQAPVVAGGRHSAHFLHRGQLDAGRHRRPLLDALLDAQLPVALVQPGRVRHFAKGLGIPAKTDGIDAPVLAIYAQKAEP